MLLETAASRNLVKRPLEAAESAASVRYGPRNRTANGLVSSVEPMAPETGMMYLAIRGRRPQVSFQNWDRTDGSYRNI
jgi:hypothetical protein